MSMTIIAASLIELAKLEESIDVDALDPVRNAIAAKLTELRAEVAAEGAHLWVCEWTAELKYADIAFPSSDVKKYIVPSRRWPKAAEGETVVFNDTPHRVMVNAVYKNPDGWHQVNFGIYILMP